MKKIVKKLLAFVSATVICASPMMSTSLVNAAGSSRLNTYVVYCDIPSNSGVTRVDLEMYYEEGDYSSEVTLGDFDGLLSFHPSATTCVTTFKAKGSMAASGNLFRVNFWSDSDFNVKSMRTIAFDSEFGYMGENIATTEIVLVGDANNNGSVTMSDVTAILQFIGNPKDYKLSSYRAADVNYDGLVTKEDAELIISYVNGEINCF